MEYIAIQKFDLSSKITNQIAKSTSKELALKKEIEQRKIDMIKVGGSLILALIDIHIELKKQGKILDKYIDSVLDVHSKDHALEVILNERMLTTHYGNVVLYIWKLQLWHCKNRGGTGNADNSTIQIKYEGWIRNNLEELIDLIIKDTF